jgi:hypothetical protein
MDAVKSCLEFSRRCRRFRHAVMLLIAASLALGGSNLLGESKASASSKKQGAKQGSDRPTTDAADPVYEELVINGWNVRVNKQLREQDSAAVDKALKLLRGQLDEIVRVVPPKAVVELRKKDALDEPGISRWAATSRVPPRCSLARR